MVAYAVLLVLWSETLGIPNDTVGVFLWLWLGTVAWNIEARPRYHLNFLKDWWIPVVGLVIYFFTRGLTDEIGLPVHVTMPIRFDEWIGFGHTPTERLQHALCGNPCVKSSALTSGATRSEMLPRGVMVGVKFRRTPNSRN